MSAEALGPSPTEMGQNPWDFQARTSETEVDRANREAMDRQAATANMDFGGFRDEVAEAVPVADQASWDFGGFKEESASDVATANKADWDFSPKNTETAVKTVEQQNAEIEAENRKYVWDFDPQSIAANNGEVRRLRTAEEMTALEARESLLAERPETVAHIGQDVMELAQRA